MARAIKIAQAAEVDLGVGDSQRQLMLWLQSGVVLTLYLGLYGRLLPELIADWYNYGFYSHGFLVPLTSAYVVWKKKDSLKSVPFAPSLWGAAGLLAAVILYAIGDLGGDAFTKRMSLVLALMGVVQVTAGTRYLKALRFPLLYLFLMVPFPYVAVKAITNALMFFDAFQAANILQLAGVPVFLDSNYLYLPNIVLEVADACSGISSIFALFVVGVVYSHFLPIRPVTKVVLALSTVPLAILANLFRIIVTVALTYYIGPVVLQSLLHKFTGTLNFLCSVLLLIAVGEMLRRTYSAAEEPTPVDRPISDRLGGRRRCAFAMLTGAIILATGVWLAGVLEGTGTGATSKGLQKLPSSLGPYTASRIAWPDVYTDPKVQEAINRGYSNATGVPIEIFVGVRGNSAGEGRLQSPKSVLPERWNSIWVKLEPMRSAGAEIEGTWMLTQRGDDKRMVLYWYESDGKSFSGEIRYRLALLKARLFNPTKDLAVIRIATPVQNGESEEQAQDRLKDFVAYLYPELAKILRR